MSSNSERFPHVYMPESVKVKALDGKCGVAIPDGSNAQRFESAKDSG